MNGHFRGHSLIGLAWIKDELTTTVSVYTETNNAG